MYFPLCQFTPPIVMETFSTLNFSFWIEKSWSATEFVEKTFPRFRRKFCQWKIFKFWPFFKIMHKVLNFQFFKVNTLYVCKYYALNEIFYHRIKSSFLLIITNKMANIKLIQINWYLQYTYICNTFTEKNYEGVCIGNFQYWKSRLSCIRIFSFDGEYERPYQ